MAFTFTDLLNDPNYQPLLPFIFVFVIVYGMLSSIPNFKWGQKVNIVLALVFGAFGAGYTPFLAFFYANFSMLLWFFVIMFMILFAGDILGLRKNKYKGKETALMMGMALILLVFLMLVGLGYFDNVRVLGLEKNELLIVIGILFLLLIFYYAYEHSRTDIVQTYLEEAKRQGKW